MLFLIQQPELSTVTSAAARTMLPDWWQQRQRWLPMRLGRLTCHGPQTLRFSVKSPCCAPASSYYLTLYSANIFQLLGDIFHHFLLEGHDRVV